MLFVFLYSNLLLFFAPLWCSWRIFFCVSLFSIFLFKILEIEILTKPYSCLDNCCCMAYGVWLLVVLGNDRLKSWGNSRKEKRLNYGEWRIPPEIWWWPMMTGWPLASFTIIGKQTRVMAVHMRMYSRKSVKNISFRTDGVDGFDGRPYGNSSCLCR
jgi:hypothetical protein